MPYGDMFLPRPRAIGGVAAWGPACRTDHCRKTRGHPWQAGPVGAPITAVLTRSGSNKTRCVREAPHRVGIMLIGDLGKVFLGISAEASRSKRLPGRSRISEGRARSGGPHPTLTTLPWSTGTPDLGAGGRVRVMPATSCLRMATGVRTGGDRQFMLGGRGR